MVRGRWVEECHKGLKTSAGLERLQLESRGPLDPTIGVLSVVAAALVNGAECYQLEGVSRRVRSGGLFD